MASDPLEPIEKWFAGMAGYTMRDALAAVRVALSAERARLAAAEAVVEASRRAILAARAGADLYDAIEEIWPYVEGQPYANIRDAMSSVDAAIDLDAISEAERALAAYDKARGP